LVKHFSKSDKPMDHMVGLKCSICGRLYQPGEVEYVCPEHGNDGNLDVVYDYERVNARWQDFETSSQTGIWRYKALLPIELNAAVPPLLVGNTPLYRTDNVARQVGVAEVWVKDDGRNPTASLKDRASALVVARALAEGREIITTASTGNAGAALAGLAASIQLPNVIFAPATAPEAKIAQLLVYGSHVILVEGTYDDAFDLCLQATQAYGWYCRNTGYNPYTAEGKKTVSFEICEQLSGGAGISMRPMPLSSVSGMGISSAASIKV
jgi:threonine synthase